MESISLTDVFVDAQSQMVAASGPGAGYGAQGRMDTPSVDRPYLSTLMGE